MLEMLDTNQFLVELSKIFIGSRCSLDEIKTMNFYVSRGFYFVCEDGRVIQVGYEGE